MNEVIIVTGGSKGIGASIVEELAHNDYKVILNYNNSEKEAVTIKNKLEKQGYIIDIYKADIRKKEEVKKLIDFCIDKYKKIDGLINNAGISQIKLFTEIDEDDWNNMISTNLTGTFYCCQEVVKQMLKQKSGNIINISSIWGEIGASCEVHYSASKAGIIGLTKSLAKELGPSNIKVNCIAPGIIDTEMNSALTEEDYENLKNEIPLNKIGNTKDIANCIIWLLKNEYITGQVISINGGWKI